MSETSPSRQNNVRSESSRLWRFSPVALACFIGLSVSIFAFSSVRRWEYERTQIDFDRRSAAIAASIQKGIDEDIGVLQSVQGLYDASREVERLEFRAFVSRALKRHPGIQALGWVPRVLAAERSAYESEARRDGLTDFRFREKDGSGGLKEAARRQHYFPVYFLEPYQENKSFLGFDLASISSCHESAVKACDTGLESATGIVQLVP